jgi:cysteine-rich repeat protein
VIKHFGVIVLVSGAGLALACSTDSGSTDHGSGSLPPPELGAPSHELGRVDLALSVPGVDVDLISYDIVDAITNVTVRTGVADVSATDAQAKVSVLLPPGSYIAKLHATGSVTCTGQTPTFVITAGSSTAAVATLACGTASSVDNGNANIDATFNPANTCGLTEMFVGPLTQGATDDITLLGEALPPSSVQFVWTSSNPAAGTLNNPNSSVASLTCSNVGGSTTITLSITDTADIDCADQQSVTVLCVGGSHCGDGTLDPGEQCDDGNAVSNDACDNGCLLPVCGDGIVEDTEQCDDGNVNNLDACSNACVLAVCGDGLVQAPEACDDHNLVSGDGCSNSCAWENICSISNMFVAPLTQGAGGNITLSAQADPPATVRFTWLSSNAAAGTLNNPNSANATLTCSAVGGNSTITLIVTDSLNPACFDGTSVPVTCRTASP